MEKTLRVREETTNGEPAIYAGVDLGSPGMVARGKTTPVMVKEMGGHKRLTITFVPDTYHNRAFFLQRSTVELAEWLDNEWVVIQPSWLEVAFSPAKGGLAIPTGIKKPEPPKPQAKPEKPTTITDAAAFAKIPKSQQVAQLKKLFESETPEEFKKMMLNDIIKSEDPNLANTTKQQAEKFLKGMSVGV